MNYTFILNNIQPDFTEEIEVIPKHFFRNANQNEIENIKSTIKSLGGPYLPFFDTPVYESKWKKEDCNGSQDYFYAGPDKWRYYVIAFEGNNSKINVLQYASNLIKNHMDFGFTILKMHPEGMGIAFSNSFRTIYQYHNDPMLYFKEPSILTENDMRLISEYHDLIEQFSDNFPFIKKAVSKLSILKQIPPDSDLLILGYFSIIESLITHAPRSNETLDLINHQIANKIILLRKRFD